MEKLEGINEALLRAFTESPFAPMSPLVYGEGSLHPKLMLIGEAPGEQEALLGHPFVGKAGKNLDGFLRELRLEREEIFISNTVKFRPWALGKSGRKVNRPPKKEEIAFFLPYLYREVEQLAPPIVVTLGNVALHAFADETIGNVHGRQLPLSFGKGELFPLYHPASVIYNPGLKEVYHWDLVLLRQILDERAQ